MSDDKRTNGRRVPRWFGTDARCPACGETGGVQFRHELISAGAQLHGRCGKCGAQARNGGWSRPAEDVSS